MKGIGYPKLDDRLCNLDYSRQRSAAVAFRVLIDSRRASSATSSPILFRYLEQSATVLATKKMRTGTLSTFVGFLAELERLF